MARRTLQFGIKTHPMLNKIIDLIIEGEKSDREISKSVRPVIAHSAVYNYRKNVVEPSMRDAEKLKAVLSPNKVESTGFSDVLPVKEQGEQIVKSALLAAPVLAVREKRIAALQDRHNRLQMIVDERSVAHADVPGGKSGLLTEKLKNTGVEYALDSTLLSEFREHEKQVAQELGQWNEGNQVNTCIQIVMPASADRAPNPNIELEYIDIGE